MEPASFCFAGWCSTKWTTPVRAFGESLKCHTCAAGRNTEPLAPQGSQVFSSLLLRWSQGWGALVGRGLEVASLLAQHLLPNHTLSVQVTNERSQGLDCEQIPYLRLPLIRRLQERVEDALQPPSAHSRTASWTPCPLLENLQATHLLCTHYLK